MVFRSKAVNLTTVLRPSNVGTVTYYWWFNNKTEVNLEVNLAKSHRPPLISGDWQDRPAVHHSFRLFVFKPVVTLDGTMSFTFSKEGSHTVTVQASVGNTVLQDQMTVAVYGASSISQCLSVPVDGPMVSINIPLFLSRTHDQMTQAHEKAHLI